MTVSEIRQTFFDYFESKGHTIVPSAPMVVKDDPTLMFVNAGMNQFKDYFLGNAVPKHRRVANSQKCLRVSGKHNDLEEVGVDTYHHTMFEMLGNWSFGDYFKEEAIGWAWDLLTNVYKLPKDRLYVTVFEGDAKDGVPKDDESYQIWKKYIDENRIILASKKDNFWEMGDMGPCGPCTEIHVDLRNEEERKRNDGKTLVNADHPQVIEIWNNVFMEFNRKADSSLEPLPAKHVDTGMGLERLSMALQHKQSNYDTDLFQTLIRHMEGVSGVKYGKSEETDIALRVIADHVRAISFAIADGQIPASNGAGYVIRRILRRAVRYGYSTLGLRQSFLAELSRVLADLMGDPFSELLHQKDLVYKVITEEENSFFRTLELGLKRMDLIIERAQNEGIKIVDGKQIFELYDTYGFPVDLTSLIAREHGLAIDEEAFDQELTIQKNRSRAATAMETDDWITLIPNHSDSFIGYDTLEADVRIVKYRKVIQKQKEFYQVVFDTTPFYPEGGGQVGDSGAIVSKGQRYAIFDTKKENNLILHMMTALPDHPEEVFRAEVAPSKRRDTARNHSATHLLHHALRKVLGSHVEQKGSMVNADYLRFDFSHFEKISEEQLAEIGTLVEDQIRHNVPLNEQRNTPIEEAKKMGAMALFGEKYGDAVRVIQFGTSIELCGGTHVRSTGDIGLFVITTETAVAAGVRRIEAITGRAAEAYFKERSLILDQINNLLRNPKDPVKGIGDLLTENQRLQKEAEQFRKQIAQAVKSELKQEIKALDGIQVLNTTVTLDMASVKDILFQLRSELPNFVGIVGNLENDKCGISVIINEDLGQQKGWDARLWIKEVSAMIQGGGGGQPFFATAGGKNKDGLKAGLNEILQKIVRA